MHKDTQKLETVITIDGPVGSGKSTVAAKLAKKLRFVHLNSGALFRSVALHAQSKGVDASDELRIAEVACDLDFRFLLASDGTTQFQVNGEDPGAEIFSAAVGEMGSKIAVHPRLRSVLVDVQRSMAIGSPLVLEGRDAGTVVFPDAEFKFYLDAPLEVRARRRLQVAIDRGEATEDDFAQFCVEVAGRDERDSRRATAPLSKAQDAIVVDTGNLSIDEVVDRLAEHVGAAE